MGSQQHTTRHTHTSHTHTHCTLACSRWLTHTALQGCTTAARTGEPTNVDNSLVPIDNARQAGQPGRPITGARALLTPEAACQVDHRAVVDGPSSQKTTDGLSTTMAFYGVGHFLRKGPSAQINRLDGRGERGIVTERGIPFFLVFWPSLGSGSISPFMWQSSCRGREV